MKTYGTNMNKLTGAALDRAVANTMGLKSLHNCEEWGEHMKVYKHSNGELHWYPETIPKGWYVQLDPNTFDVMWCRH